jgi:hypothetical protein
VLVFEHYAGTWNALRPVVWMTLVIVLAVLPAWVVFAATFPLLDANLCLTGHSATPGVYVGEASDRVYVGEPEGVHPRRVVSVPLTQVREVAIGGSKQTPSC